MVSRCHVGNPGSHLDHDAGTLVAGENWKLHGGRPGDQVIVRVAHADRFELDLYLTFAGSPISISSTVHGCRGPHSSAPLVFINEPPTHVSCAAHQGSRGIRAGVALS
jgi:hypothetical protein